MRNFILYCIKRLNRLLSLLGLRSQRHWGVVYDSVTKQPVDPVVVKLIDVATGKVIASNVANMHGEYGFMASPGLYKMFAQRAHYVFPSGQITTPHDGIYRNVYTGQLIEFKDGSDVLSLNIPLDPIASDWNQQDKLRVVKVRPGLEQLWRIFATTLFWLMLLASGVAYVLFQSTAWLYIAVGLLAVLFLAWVTPEVRLWGRITDHATGYPLSEVTIHVTHPTLTDVIIASAVTTDEGKFFIRLAKGNYRVSIQRPGKYEPVVKMVNIGAEGLLNNEWKV